LRDASVVADRNDDACMSDQLPVPDAGRLAKRFDGAGQIIARLPARIVIDAVLIEGVVKRLQLRTQPVQLRLLLRGESPHRWMQAGRCVGRVCTRSEMDIDPPPACSDKGITGGIELPLGKLRHQRGIRDVDGVFVKQVANKNAARLFIGFKSDTERQTV
jgi:hypothetical protein